MRSVARYVAAAVLLVPALALGAEYEIDPVHTTVQFKVRHLMVTDVRGTFGKVSGTVYLDEKDITKSKVTAEIDVSSVDTREPKRDAHLKSADFFDAAKHPKITFKSTKVERAGKGKLKVHGDLTMRGVTKPVVLDVAFDGKSVKDPWGNTKLGAHASTTVNRHDFGVSWNKTLDAGGVVVGDEVHISLDVQLTEKKPASTAKK